MTFGLFVFLTLFHTLRHLTDALSGALFRRLSDGNLLIKKD